MKFPFFQQKVPEPAPIKMMKSEMELVENQIVELRRLRDIRDNLQNEIWPPAIWKLASLADTFVLGRYGIFPQFNNPEATAEWRRYKVDSRQHYSVRDLLRIICTSLIIHNECFLRLDAGTVTPMPRPYNIEYEDLTNVPLRYMWSNPRPLTLNADEVWHIMVEWYPGQKRGDSTLWVMYDLLNDRRNYIKSVIKMAKNAARMAIFYKRVRGNPLVDEDTTEEDVKERKEQIFNFDEDTFLEIGPSDNVETVTAGSPSIPPSEIDRLVMGTVGQRAGLSRMAVSGDFSEATYSSGRFADMNDHGVWDRLQMKMLEVVEYLYFEWPSRVLYSSNFRKFFVPPYPYIDPARVATVNTSLVNMKAKAVQEVIIEDGRDPEEVFDLIEEFNRRFPSEPSGSGEFPGQGRPTIQQQLDTLEKMYVDN